MVCNHTEILNIDEKKTDENLKPKALKVQLDKIPQSLTSMRRWVLWRYEWKDSRWTKVLYNPHVFCELEEHKRASSTNPKTWGSFKQVANLYNKYGSQIDGVGFVLSDKDGIVGIDLDKTKDTPHEDHFLKLGTYVERSPSGKGLRLFGYGTMPNNEGRKKDWLELYNNVRFLTITGHRQTDTDDLNPIQDKVDALLQKYFPAETKAAVTKSTVPQATKPITAIASMQDEAIVELALDNDSFSDCWYGIIDDLPIKEDGSIDRSRVLFSMCIHLAYYTKDAKQIERIIDASSWGDYEKWKERAKWRENCIQKALAKQDKFYVSDDLIAKTVATTTEPTSNTETNSLPILEPDLLRTRSEILSKSKVWAADNWIQLGKVGLFHGKAKRGKSTAMMDLAASLVLGDKWLNLIQCQRLPVLLVDYENEEDYISENIFGMIEARGRQWEESRGYLYVVDPQRIKDYLSPFDVDKVCEIIEHVQKRSGIQHGVFVIDTARPAFNNLFDEANWEWAASTVRTAIDLVREVKTRTGWGGIIIHHDTKGNNTASGSGDWEGAVDYSIGYTLKDDKSEATICWTGRSKNPPCDVKIVKTGDILTGTSTDHNSVAAEALLSIQVKSYLDEKKRSQSAIIKLVKNKWNGEKAPSDKAIIGALQYLLKNDEVCFEKGINNASFYWVE